MPECILVINSIHLTKRSFVILRSHNTLACEYAVKSMEIVI